jgi:hypothetical protein
MRAPRAATNGDCKGDSEVTTKEARTGRSSWPRRTRETSCDQGLPETARRWKRDETKEIPGNERGKRSHRLRQTLDFPRVMMLLATVMAFGAFYASAGYSLLATREAALGDEV